MADANTSARETLLLALRLRAQSVALGESGDSGADLPRRSASAAEGKPVAWRWTSSSWQNGSWVLTHVEPDAGPFRTIEPLYAASALTASPAGDDPKALDAAARSSSTEAAEQEVERLREALRPFALIASGNEWDSVPDSHVLDLTYSSEAGGQETVAELSFSFFRQALAALAPSLPGKEEGQ